MTKEKNVEKKGKGLLAQQILLKALEESPIFPKEFFEDQKQEVLETIIGIIIFHLTDAIIRLVDKEDTPAKIWKKLYELF